MNQAKSVIPKLETFLTTICAVLMLVFSGQALAQAGIDTGRVTGTVKDPTGALVVGANCTLTNTATGVTQNTTTTSAGAYAFPIVQVGTYTIKVSAKEFQDFQINGIIVHVGSTATEDVRLKVGATTAEVTVSSSAAPLLQAQDASLGTTIDSAAATGLPLFGGQGGRDFMSLVTTVAGVQFGSNNSDSTTAFLVHGTTSGAVDVRVNGVDDNAELQPGTYAFTIAPIPDAIEEMKVETGDNDADVGRAYGAVVNVVTKQGTNKFRGTAWEYNENDMFNANDYFNKRTELSGGHPNRPGRFKENSYGAIFGGPVVIPHVYDGHNKTFFTADFQYTYYNVTSVATETVPTATMQNSGFTNLVDVLNQSSTKIFDGTGRTFQAGTIFDPATTRAIACGTNDPISGLLADCGKVIKNEQGIITDPNINAGVQSAIIRDPYFQEIGQPAGCPSLLGTTNWVSTVASGPVSPSCFNQLPSSRFDPNAVALIKLYPKTWNNAGIDPTTGLSTGGTHSYSSNYYDQIYNPVATKQYDVRLDHTFNAEDSAFLTISHFNNVQTPSLTLPAPLEGATFWISNPSYLVAFTETHVFNPHLINEFRAGEDHNYLIRVDGDGLTSTVGIPRQYGIQGIPETTNNGGLPDFNFGSGLSSVGVHANGNWQKDGAWQFSDNLTKIVGKHQWKFGAEYWWVYEYGPVKANTRGSFSYGGFSNLPNSGDGGPGMTDFLLRPSANLASSAYLAAGGLSTASNDLGGVSSYSGTNTSEREFHLPYFAGYAVDNWKVTPSLTLNLGLREDYFGPLIAASGMGGIGSFWMGGADGNEASGSAYYISKDACNVTRAPAFNNLLAYNNIPIICRPNNSIDEQPTFNFAPRLGAAYRIRPNLVVRAGAGMAYTGFFIGNIGEPINYPFVTNVQQGAGYSYKPQLVSNSATAPTTPTMENLFAIVDMTSALNAYQPLGSVNLIGKPYHDKNAYVGTLDLAVQWQFTNHDSIEVRWVGSLGRQLEGANSTHNAPRQALPPNTAAVTPCTAGQLAANPYCENSPFMPDGTYTIPFPNMAPSGAIEQTEQISNYYSGEAEYQHKFGGGFNMDANYTYASCLSDTQGGQQNAGDPGNGRATHVVGFGGFRADYDRCENLAAQMFKLSGEYSLPFGKGALVGGNANPLEDAVIGGWKLDPIWISQSGILANISCQGTIGGIANAPGQFTGPWFQTGSTGWSCGAPLVKGVNPYGPGANDHARTKVTGYWNSAAFTAPAYAVTSVGSQDFTPYGVRGNQIYGPGWYDVDLAAHKDFKVTENSRLQITAMAINAFNHVHLNNPSTGNYTQPQNETLTGGWGTITGDASNNGAGRILQFAGKLYF
jgi:hypothetical protein